MNLFYSMTLTGYKVLGITNMYYIIPVSIYSVDIQKTQALIKSQSTPFPRTPVILLIYLFLKGISIYASPCRCAVRNQIDLHFLLNISYLLRVLKVNMRKKNNRTWFKHMIDKPMHITSCNLSYPKDAPFLDLIPEGWNFIL